MLKFISPFNRRRRPSFLKSLIAPRLWWELQHYVLSSELYVDKWITGTITRDKAKRDAKSFSPLRGLHVDFSLPH